MGDKSPDEASIEWPSVDHAAPVEEGGPVARTGFNYQDEIAVSFLIEMLESQALLKTHCETHDDILLVRESVGLACRIAEFVQVKSGEPDKLWSVADLCQRKKNQAGTSLYERSLARDGHQEDSRFRIVTLRPVVGALKPLTYACGSVGREPDCDKIKAIRGEVESRFPGQKSTKGNGADFWLENCQWDERAGEQDVRRLNLLRIIELSFAEGRALLPEQAAILLEELRRRAKDAGAAKWNPDRDKKIITRIALRAWWESRLEEQTGATAARSGGKLVAKMAEAGLPADMIALAVDLRRRYSDFSRTPRYLEIDDAERLPDRVKSEVVSLRARLLSGQIELDGPGFHSLCLDRMDKVNDQRASGTDDQSAFLKGCLYDITDRCMLRFVRPQ